MSEPTKAFDEKEITLPSGITLLLQPLSLKNLRKFMRIWSEHIDWVRTVVSGPEEGRPSEAEFADKQFDVYEKLLALGLDKALKAYNEENETSTKMQVFIDDEVDEKSMYVILEVTGGLKLDPDEVPNLTKSQQDQ